MSAANMKYVPPVQGRQIEVLMTRQLVDPNDLDKFTDLAVDIVDSQPDEIWTDAFFITSDSYELTSCTCLLPTIVCQSMVDEPHNVATSRQTGETMVIF